MTATPSLDRLLVIRRMKPLGFTLAEMRDLLDALDALNDAGASQEQRTTAASYLQQCRTKAQESATTLRKQLTYAEELAELLAAKADEVVANRDAPR